MKSSTNAIRAVLIDLSGTLHIEDTAIPGSVAALSRLLQDSDVGVRFVTNTTKKSAADLVRELHAIGFGAVRAEHVLTTGGIARALLEREQLRPLLLVHDSLRAEFTGADCENPTAVVIGLAPEHFNYDTMNAAFRVLLGGGRLIALNKAQSFASKTGLNIGPGAFVSALEYATGVESTVIGKPCPDFFRQALQDLDVAPEHAVMIGDDVRQDVGGAMAIGMRAVLVRTGRYRAGDEDTLGTASPPSFVAQDFAAAVEWVLKQKVVAAAAARTT